jgi:O-antigen/teichoic acid export membrane protein
VAIHVRDESKLLARHSVIYGIGTSANKIVGFLLLPVYTQYLSTREYGIKELVGLSTDIIGVLLATAISSAFYRFYFDYTAESDRMLVLSSSYIFLGIFGLFFVGLLSLGSPVMARYILDSSDLSTYFLIALASLWFQTINTIGLNYLRVTLRSIQYVVLSIFRLVLAIGLNIYFIIFLRMGVLGILISTLITSIVTTLVLNVPQLAKAGLRYSPSIVRDMLKFGLPMIPSQFGTLIVNLSDRFFLKGYCSIAEAGLYSLGYRFGILPGTFISEPFNQVWQPRRLEMYTQDNAEEVFGRIFTYFLLFISFAALGVAVLTRDILVIIADREFWSAYKIVPVIALANVIFTFHYHFNMGIIIEKKTKYLAYINVSNAALVLLLNFLLIPRYGMYGAAYATLIAYIYKAASTYFFSNRFFKIHFEFVRMGKIFLAAAGIFVLSQQIELGSVYAGLLVKTLLVLLFPAALYLMSFFTPEEKSGIASIFRPAQGVVKPWD